MRRETAGLYQQALKHGVRAVTRDISRICHETEIRPQVNEKSLNRTRGHIQALRTVLNSLELEIDRGRERGEGQQ